jgi:cysteinyl-tRNA synthetase
MIGIIDALMKRGMAYQAADRSVYFSIEKYRGCGCRYGQLVNLNFDQMRVGERVASDEYTKDSLADFALWKARVPEDGAVFWPSPWGEGRPGWHIECSAMSMKLLGPSFDLHLGGEDLAFPHHEDEIAQSEGAGWQPSGQRFVKHWLHGAHLLVEGKKMSKSLGNCFTLRDLLAKGFTGREIRYVLLSAHYRETFNFTLDGLEAGRAALARIDECLAKVAEVARAAHEGSGRSGSLSPIGGEGRGEGAGNAAAPPDQKLLDEFTAAMDDDLNVSKGWGTLFEWVRDTNRLIAANQLSPSAAVDGIAAWQRLDSVFGLGRKSETGAPAEIVALLDHRQAARAAKDFKRADALRDELKANGWVIEDTPKGPKLKRA